MRYTVQARRATGYRMRWRHAAQGTERHAGTAYAEPPGTECGAGTQHLFGPKAVPHEGTEMLLSTQMLI